MSSSLTSKRLSQTSPATRLLGQILSKENLLLFLLTAFVLFCSVWPLGHLFFQVIPGDTTPWQETSLWNVLTRKSTWKATLHSLETSAAATCISLFLGGSTAFFAALTDVRRKALMVFCLMIPMMIPPQVTALSWIQLFGPNSTLLQVLGLAPPMGAPNPIYSRTGIILLLGIQNTPLVFLVLRSALRRIPSDLLEAARLTGAVPAYLARTILLPMLIPPLLAAGELAFIASLGNFGIPALLGIPQSYYVLPTLIYRRLASFGPAVINDVAVLALLIALIGICVTLFLRCTAARQATPLSGKPARPFSFSLGKVRSVVEICIWSMLCAMLILPFSALLSSALVPAYGVPLTISSCTPANFIEVLLRQDVTGRAFANSFKLAAGSALILSVAALLLGYFAVWKNSRWARILSNLAEAPYSLPGVVLSIAIILTFLRPLPLMHVSLYGTIWIILIAYLSRFLSLNLRPVTAGFQQLGYQLEEAGRTCGAPFFTRLRTITFPLLGPVSAAGAILVFMTGFNELTLSALLWSAGNETLGVVLYNLDDGGYSVLAAALAVVVVIAIVGLMALTWLLSPILPAGILPWCTKDTDTL